MLDLAHLVGVGVHPALPVEQGHREAVEADEPVHRLRHLLVDPVQRERGNGERSHPVDDLEPQRAPVQPPHVLQRVTELPREAARHRLPVESARTARPHQHELAGRAGGVAQRGGQRGGVAHAQPGR